MSTPGLVPQTWVDGTKIEFTNWQDNWPSSKEGRLYARVSVSMEPLKYGTWVNQEVDEFGHYPLCMTDAIRNRDNE